MWSPSISRVQGHQRHPRSRGRDSLLVALAERMAAVVAEVGIIADGR
ncbi:MAG: hypothetical protein R2695_08125 [Acidimicrobiales bacterium]